MAKQIVTFSCGHEGELVLWGKRSDRDHKAAWAERASTAEEVSAKAREAVAAARPNYRDNYYEREQRAQNLRTLRQLEAVRAELGHGGLLTPAELDQVAAPGWIDTARAYHDLLSAKSDADHADDDRPGAGYSIPRIVRVGEYEMLQCPWDHGQRGDGGAYLVHRTCTPATPPWRPASTGSSFGPAGGNRSPASDRSAGRRRRS